VILARYFSSVRAVKSVWLSLSKPCLISLGWFKEGSPSTSSGIRVFATALFALLITTPAFAQTTAITGGTVVVGDGSAPIERGTVIVTNGRVTAAGARVAVPAGATVVDASGKWVTPGIVAGFSRLGLVGVDAVSTTNDSAGHTSSFNAAIDISPAINRDVAAIAINRAAGVTRAIVSPDASNAIFGGQGAIIDTGADADPITKPRAFQFVEFGEAGAARAGGSRPALFATFRNSLAEARDYQAGRFRDDALLQRADAAALVSVVTGATKLLIHVESATDILAVLALKKDYPALDMVLVGVSEGWRVADRIAAARVPVIASAVNDLPSGFDKIAATQSNVGRMKAAGVMLAIGMIDDNDTRQAMHAAQYAGNLVALTKVPGASGLSWGDAFAAITSKPAEVMGMGGEIGSLRAGRRGDVVIWDGDPLELSSGVEAVWIDGVRQPLVTRQTRLRDRYARPGEGDLPKAFDR
jgi:imidazolonepropionase-like amidohydrolase